MSISRRSLLCGSAVLATGLAVPRLAPAALQASGPVFTPEQFGARGDGVTNDTAAFARLGAAISRRGGGTIELRKVTYVVGQQSPVTSPSASYTYQPGPVLELIGCHGPVTIRGNGARLRCADGLRYGTWDPVADRPTRHKMPFYGGQLATPYTAMVRIENCSGPIEVADLELDGNVDGLRIGGPHGDTGHQIPALGLALLNNGGSERISNVHTHHHAQDGLYIDGIDRVQRPAPARTITGVRSEYNGRQGCSIVGGRGYVFESCKFNHTGRSKSGLFSAPGAGVDIEAENGKLNRDFTFLDCEFADNAGCGFLADTGDSEGVLLRGCHFIGTTSWAAWPYKPRIRFEDCSFVGASTRAHGDLDPHRAAQFHNCRFRDDPALSPTGKVLVGDGPQGPIFDLSDSKNVLFNRCDFTLTHNGLLPWSWFAIYQDCRMQQRASGVAYPKGKYRGRNSIQGKVDLYGTTVEGSLSVNGRPLVT